MVEKRHSLFAPLCGCSSLVSSKQPIQVDNFTCLEVLFIAQHWQTKCRFSRKPRLFYEFNRCRGLTISHSVFLHFQCWFQVWHNDYQKKHQDHRNDQKYREECAVCCFSNHVPLILDHVLLTHVVNFVSQCPGNEGQMVSTECIKLFNNDDVQTTIWFSRFCGLLTMDGT